MASGAYDDLFDKPAWGGSGRLWLNALTPEARSSLDELVTLVAEQGAPSSWAAAHRIFCEKFPEYAVTPNPFKKTVRELVKQRG